MSISYKQLIELSAQALDMENELTHLRSENEKLIKEKENCIERHDELYITLKGDADKTLYCSPLLGSRAPFGSSEMLR